MKNYFSSTLKLLTMLLILSSFLVACGDNTPVESGQANAATVPANTSTIAPITATPSPTSTKPPTLPGSPFPGQPPTATPAGEIPKQVKAQIGTSFKLRFGQVAQVEAENIQLSLNQVIEDSRCPSNVNCTWSGQLIVNVTPAKAGKSLPSFELNTLDAVRNKDKPTFENYNLALVGATPAHFYSNYGTDKAEITVIKPEDYVLELVITKVEKGIITPGQAVLDRRVQLKYGQTAYFPVEGLSFKFTALTKEQRCPKVSNSVCSTSGEASIALTATKTGLNQSQTLSLTIPGLVDDTSDLVSKTTTPGYTATFEGYKIQLISLQPQRVSTDPAKAAAPDLYIATLVVTKLP